MKASHHAHEMVDVGAQRRLTGDHRARAVHGSPGGGVLVSAPRIAVVGGSLTGPAVALFLQHVGIDCQLYEAVPEAVTLAGGVIGLRHPALTALETVGISQDEIVPLPEERVISIKVLDRHEVDHVRTIYPGRTMTWTLLNHALRSRLNPGIYHSGKRVVDVRGSAQGAATLLFADGSDASADIIIFADGRKSIGRKIFDPSRGLRYSGYVAHRGMQVDCPPDMLAGFMNFHPDNAQFATFPACTDGGLHLDWTFYLNTSEQLFTEQFGDGPTRRTFVFPKQVSKCVYGFVDSKARRQLPSEQAHVVETTTERMASPVIDIDKPDKMVFELGDSRVMLLGDALAPVRPHTGRGANNGIDQAWELAQVMHQHRRWGADLDTALGAWQVRRLPDVLTAIDRGPLLGSRLGLGVSS